jgi:MraZ protein
LGVNCGYRCLTVYTTTDFQSLTDNYNALPVSQRSAASSLLFMNAVNCTPDKQFRFALSQFLLDYAGITRDVMIVGRAGQAEIWDAEEFAAFERENLTPEKLLASLEAIGL